LADNTTFEQWSSEGSVESHERARARAVKMLDSFEAPALDPSINDGLRDFIGKRMEELPDSEF
jgi:trimethylamine--corrinoid protein Co-methyltransferase